MILNSGKKLVHKFYSLYDDKFPIQRGKYRMRQLMKHVVGDARYDIKGLSLNLSPLSLIDTYLIEGGGFGENVTDKLQEIFQEEGNFIDVGANIGYISLYVAELLKEKGKVFSFEPSPREFRKLKTHIELNNTANIIAFNKGIGRKIKTDNLYISDISNHGNNSRHRKKETVDCVEAEFSPVNQLIAIEDLKSVKCVKIDTEGDEMSVLEGFEDSMQHLKKAMFIVEITEKLLNLAGYKPQDIYDFFKRHSFRPILNTGPQSISQYDEFFVAD